MALGEPSARLTLAKGHWVKSLTPKERRVLRDESSVFLGLGVEAIVRGVDLRVLATTRGRFAHLVFKDWVLLYRQQHRLRIQGRPVLRDETGG